MVCPFCTRKFNQKAYQRHVDYCKSKAEEKAREERFRSRNSSQRKLSGTEASGLGIQGSNSKIPTLSRSGSSTSFNSNLSSYKASREGSTSSRIRTKSSVTNIHSKRYDAKQLLKNQQNAGTIRPKQISFKINSGSVGGQQPQPSKQQSANQKFCTQCGWKFAEETFMFCGDCGAKRVL